MLVRALCKVATGIQLQLAYPNRAILKMNVSRYLVKQQKYDWVSEQLEPGTLRPSGFSLWPSYCVLLF